MDGFGRNPQVHLPGGGPQFKTHPTGESEQVCRLSRKFSGHILHEHGAGHLAKLGTAPLVGAERRKIEGKKRPAGGARGT